MVEDETTTTSENNTGSQKDDPDSKLSEAERKTLETEADIRISDQKEKLTLLRNQADRLEMIKYGILSAVLLAGFFNGNADVQPSTIELLSSMFWFLLVGLGVVVSAYVKRNFGYFYKPFLIGMNSAEDNRIKDDLIEELEWAARVEDNEDVITKKHEAILENEKELRDLERQLRHSHFFIFAIFTGILFFGLPNLAITEASQLIGSMANF